MGWAAPIPVQVTMNRLTDDQRPQSDDPKFWDVWIGEEEREVDWETLIVEWIEEG